MDKFQPFFPVPEGVPNGQLPPFKVSADHPPGPYAADLVERVARELGELHFSFRFMGGKAAYDAAKRILRGEAVWVPPDPLPADWYQRARCVLVPRSRHDRDPAGRNA